MTITINGNGTVTGLAAGGLPDGSIVAADLASGVGSPEYTSFHAGLNSDQTISTGTWTDIVFNVDSGGTYWDTGSDFNTSNGQWTVPFTGKYFYYAMLRFDALGNGKVCYISLYNGNSQIGTSMIKFHQERTGDNDFEIKTAGICALDASDTITVRGYHDHGSNRDVNANNCAFGVFYLKGE